MFISHKIHEMYSCCLFLLLCFYLIFNNFYNPDHFRTTFNHGVYSWDKALTISFPSNSFCLCTDFDF